MIYRLAILWAFALLSSNAVKVNFINNCKEDLTVYRITGGDNPKPAQVEHKLAPSGEKSTTINGKWEGHFRNIKGDQATLAEMTYDPSKKQLWYDISIIPPGPGNCKSHKECLDYTKKVGFNVAMRMQPSKPDPKNNCKTVTCLKNGCEEAYKFPSDNIHTHVCKSDMAVTFCPNGKSEPAKDARSNNGKTEAPTEVPSNTTTMTPVPYLPKVTKNPNTSPEATAKPKSNGRKKCKRNKRRL